jgi:hypothetical protein
VKPNVFLSGRNLPTVHVLPYSDVSTYHILWSDVVLIEAGAIGHTLAPIAEREPAPSTIRKGAAKNAPKASAAPAKKTAAKKVAAKKAPAAKKTTAKPVAKKAAAKKKGKEK